jgi:UDP-glucose 4-epimerase
MSARERLTVAVTGPTGEIGRSLLTALDRSAGVERVIGMARRAFDPSAHGYRKVTYHRGDVLDPVAVASLLAEADVLVHLAFIIMGSPTQTRAVNLVGSRNVFAACTAAKVKRLVYASSVAAYGFRRDNPRPLTEDVPARGSRGHYYSAQKAEVEQVLADTLAGSNTEAYVFRPCIVAGPDAPALINNLPYTQISRRLPPALSGLLGALPVLRPVLPDPGVPLQLVHHDDVASAMLAAVLGNGPPGVYNLAGAGTISISQIASELGWHAVKVPHLMVDATAQAVASMPLLPAQMRWIQAVREPVVMDTTRARRELHWRPKHDALATLREMIAAKNDD